MSPIENLRGRIVNGRHRTDSSVRAAFTFDRTNRNFILGGKNPRMCRKRQVATLLLVLSMVLAGCSGGGPATTTTATESTATETPPTAGAVTATDGETTTTVASTTTAREAVTVTGGDLRVDQTAVFYRVQRLLGTDVRPQS